MCSYTWHVIVCSQLLLLRFEFGPLDSGMPRAMPRISTEQLFVDTRVNEQMGTCRVFLAIEDCAIYVLQCNIRTMNRLSAETTDPDDRDRERHYAVVRIRFIENSEDDRASSGVDGEARRVTFVRWICVAEYRNMARQTGWAEQQGM